MEANSEICGAGNNDANTMQYESSVNSNAVASYDSSKNGTQGKLDVEIHLKGPTMFARVKEFATLKGKAEQEYVPSQVIDKLPVAVSANRPNKIPASSRTKSQQAIANVYGSQSA